MVTVFITLVFAKKKTKMYWIIQLHPLNRIIDIITFDTVLDQTDQI